jgi:hypothetical protein
MTRTEHYTAYAIVFIGLAVATALVFLGGCGTLTLRPVQTNHALRMSEMTYKLEVPRETLNATIENTQAQCDVLDSRVMGWTGTSIASGILGGGSGLASVFTETTPRYVVGGIGVGLATLAGISAYLSTAYAQKFARRCTVNVGGREP